jgi:hypothetical protein
VERLGHAVHDGPVKLIVRRLVPELLGDPRVDLEEEVQVLAPLAGEGRPAAGDLVAEVLLASKSCAPLRPPFRTSSASGGVTKWSIRRPNACCTIGPGRVSFEPPD